MIFYEITIDFIDKKKVENFNLWERIIPDFSHISVTGDEYKLPPLFILKGKKGNTIENSFKNL